MDRTCSHPSIIPLVRAILGPDAVLEEHSVMIRDPISELTDPADEGAAGSVFESRFHRDGGGKIYKDRPFTIFMCQVIYFLDDVDETTHQFSIVPESADEKRRLPVRAALQKGVPVIDETRERLRAEVAAGEKTGVGVVAKAGDAVVINSASLHAATIRQTNCVRRTIHVYFGRADQPSFSEVGVFLFFCDFNRKMQKLPPFSWISIRNEGKTGRTRWHHHLGGS
jgi:ectoine hydroxylase-related dioxygenase (phytanoyl-CoA dioxygenase family)